MEAIRRADLSRHRYTRTQDHATNSSLSTQQAARLPRVSPAATYDEPRGKRPSRPCEYAEEPGRGERIRATVRSVTKGIRPAEVRARQRATNLEANARRGRASTLRGLEGLRGSVRPSARLPRVSARRRCEHGDVRRTPRQTPVEAVRVRRRPVGADMLRPVRRLESPPAHFDHHVVEAVRRQKQLFQHGQGLE